MTHAVARKPRWLYSIAKRFADVIIAGTGLIVLAPLFAIVALVVWSRLGSPVIFRQPRAGFRQRPFTLMKFRTMTDAVDAEGRPLPDAFRLSPVGKWLRATSLDEAPSLVNIVRGEMSIIGPRPLPLDYLPLYSPEQQRRHDMLPGLTGWAQVNGRNAVDWAERLAMDVWYVDHASFGLDLRIALLTVRVVLSQQGVSAPGEATMTRFTGTPPTSGK